MILKKVRIENFRCYGMPTDFIFEEPINKKRNIYLIGGYNQYGKTTFLNAIQYCFFGIFKNEDVSSLINYKQRELGKYDIKLAVTYQDYSGHDIIIERSWVPKGSNIIRKDNPILMKENLTLFEDGTRIDSFSEDEIQQWIEGEVPRSTAKFFFFDGVEIKQFADEETDGSKLKSSIEILLGIELYRELREHLKKYIVDKIREERKDNLESQELRLRADIKDIQEKIDRIDEETEQMEIDLKELKEKENKLTEDKTELLRLIDPSSRVERDKLITECERAKIEIERLQKEIKDYVQSSFPFVLVGPDLFEMKKVLQNERESRVNKEIINKLNNLIEDLGETLSNAFCKYINIKDNAEATNISIFIKKELKKYIKNYVVIEDQIKIFSLSEDQEINLIGVIDNILLSAKDIKTMINKENDYNVNIDKFESQIKGITLDEKQIERLKKIEFKIRDTQMSIAREKQKIDYQRTQRERLIEDLDKKERELSDIEDRKINQEREILVLQHTKKYINLLDEYIDIIRRQRLNELQNHTTDLYNKLQPIVEFRGTIKFDEKDYSTKIVRNDNKILPKRDLSDGGKELYAISLVAGLCKTANKIIPIVIDFPLGHLDGINKPNVIKNYYPIAGKQVILLSKDDEIVGEYLEMLRDHLVQTFLLKRDSKMETTYVENNYFGD